MTNETTASQPKSIGDDARPGTVHELKTDPAVFAAVESGDKTHEIRLNDRDFTVGDTLLLRETWYTGAQMAGGAQLIYTGCTESRIVSHIQTGYGLADGWCILSFRAPAAQASATIQAAQKPIPMKEIGEILAEVMQIASDNGANSVTMPDAYVAVAHFTCYPQEYGFSATTQEPVMVAEPVGMCPLTAEQIFETAAPYFVWTLGGALCDWRKATEGAIGMPNLLSFTKAAIAAAVGATPAAPMVADTRNVKPWKDRVSGDFDNNDAMRAMKAEISDLRAPMVADPAGVADDDEDAEFELIQDDMLVAGTSGKGALAEMRHYAAQYEQDGPITLYRVERKRLYVSGQGSFPAATVKAVPSEALAKLTRYTQVYKEGDGATLEVDNAMGEVVMFDDVEALFAAPLADKTGGVVGVSKRTHSARRFEADPMRNETLLAPGTTEVHDE